MPRPSADNDDRAVVVATSRWRSAGSRRRRHPMRAKDPLCARYRDPDPSRIALWHGNGDFGRHAWRDHAELPDSVAELPFGGRAGLLVRRFRRSRSDLDRTAYRQGPESGSEHTETSCNTLHRQSETHQPPDRRRFPPPSAPIRSSMPPCSKLSRRGLETPECASLAERRPTLTASARAGVRNLRSGRKKACSAVKQKKDDEVKKTSGMRLGRRAQPPKAMPPKKCGFRPAFTTVSRRYAEGFDDGYPIRPVSNLLNTMTLAIGRFLESLVRWEGTPTLEERRIILHKI